MTDTLYSENLKLKVKLGQAIRALDEFEQWLNNEIGQSFQYDTLRYREDTFIMTYFKDYRKKYEI